MQNTTVIALTGATGNMLSPSVPLLLNYSQNIHLRILTRSPRSRLVKRWKKQFGGRIEVLEGSVADKKTVDAFVKGADYLINAAALIPPRSDKNADVTMSVNYGGTKNIVSALKEFNPSCKLIHISTVAIYGNRNYKHPYGRVGDPLLPSFFDVYGTSKLKGEMEVVESGLPNFAVIRQTGMLYSKILMSNVSDGLMFHTPFNVPIEWSTDLDSARLIFNIIKSDLNGECPHFWKQIYNLGGGESCRAIGYDTFKTGFSLIGGNAEKFLKPYWMATRNFHCFWFYDSDILEDMFHFRSESFESFWKRALKENPIISLGRFCPRGLIRLCLFKPLLKDKNAPLYWYCHGDKARVKAVWGGEEEFKSLPREWKDFPLLTNNENPDDGSYLDYEALRNPKNATLLSHFWSEDRGNITEGDIKTAAESRGLEYRGGFNGDVYKPVKFKCKVCGNEIALSPFGLLIAGYGCPHCTVGNPWYYNRICDFPFYKQVYFDSMKQSEKHLYFLFENGKAVVGEEENSNA